jgi:uncharacterized protein YPO0396
MIQDSIDVEGLPQPASRGFRLLKLEVLNWGTFDRRVWGLGLAGSDTLLTGDIGSGKSTLVDAVTTLLVPANRVSYNKAAGATSRERDLRSYVLGYHKSERNEVTGTSRPVPLRPAGRSHSVILGVFGDLSDGSTVSLAQVFWLKEGQAGQPERFFVVADRELGVAEDLADFGTEINALRRRLRQSGASVYDGFPGYGADFRRRLGIESDQAMELFHQTVSMKSVTDLNDFVRSHMLEPFDSAAWIDRILLHFEDLTRAHEAVLKARAQLEALVPLLRECDAHDQLRDQLLALAGQRDALRYYVAAQRAQIFAEAAARHRVRIADLGRAASELEARSGELADRRSELEVERAGFGGNRIAALERSISEGGRERERRKANAVRFNELLTEAQLPPLTAREQFTALHEQVSSAAEAVELRRTDLQNRESELAIERHDNATESNDVRQELGSLGQRRSNIPRFSLELRDRMCAALSMDAEDLPFAGELIQVRDDEAAWEGAAERLLRGFGISLLVPNERYSAVSDWIDAHHLGMRLVYYRVPAVVPAAGRASWPGADRLAHKLQIKDDTPFYPWLERELARRADHLCAATMADFRRADRAITRAGQIKEAGRHVKDDTRRLDDRRSYVLGWSNQAKIDALLEQATRLDKQRQELAAALAALQAQRQRVDGRGRALDRLVEYRSFDDLDWEESVRRIQADEQEKAQLEQSSRELARVTQALERVAEEQASLRNRTTATAEALGRARNDLEQAESGERSCRATLAAPEAATTQTYEAALAKRLPVPGPVDTDGWSAWEGSTRDALQSEIDRRQDRLRRLDSVISSMMDRFRSTYPSETTEMDAAVAAASEYRALHDRLVQDDVPRFEAEFKSYLNVNTIRDIAGFQSALRQQEDLIRERVDRINRSLVGIDYNAGRYIRLEAVRTPNVEIRDFRQELRACTDDAVIGGDDQYSEQKFVQVQRIVERFRGREGQTDADRAWTRRVTDVRNWFVFTASERYRDDDSEHEAYSDSGGKSGGQKEKLAYTILAASLAYQFRLDQPAARTFRFVVIDEAFGRGSDESTRFALRLFRLLGLQLLIVTPLQKIHVIEPYVNAVGYVDNRQGNYSRLQTLTIDEFREQQRHHAMSRLVELDSTT